jgi:hypothetical protein
VSLVALQGNQSSNEQHLSLGADTSPKLICSAVGSASEMRFTPRVTESQTGGSIRRIDW